MFPEQDRDAPENAPPDTPPLPTDKDEPLSDPAAVMLPPVVLIFPPAVMVVPAVNADVVEIVPFVLNVPVPEIVNDPPLLIRMPPAPTWAP
jgi:hypothetical protein